MIRRIVLEDFMTHRHTVLDPAPGLTILVGPNNCGKSAVIVALDQVLRNPAGSDIFVRHGAKEARVTIVTEEGATVRWTRPLKKGAIYHIRESQGAPEREVSRLDRSEAPEGLHEILRMPEIQGINVHLSDQKRPLFLFESKKTDIAKFFSSASDAFLLHKMQALLKGRQGKNKGELEIKEKELQFWQRRLSGFDGLPDLEKLSREARAAYDELQRRAATRQRMERAAAKVSDAQERLALLGVRRSVFAGLAAPPDLAPTREVRRTLEHLAKAELLRDRLAKSSAILNAASPPPNLSDERPLADLVQRIERRESHSASLNRARNALNQLQPPPTLIPTGPLNDAAARLTASEAIAARLQQERAQIESELAGARAKLEEALQAHPTCPLCGGVLRAEALLRGEHAHA